MKLEVWLENLFNNIAIFVDQDETILNLNGAGEVALKGEWAVKNAVFKQIYGRELAIIPRPHAKTFLIQCRKIAPTYILTAGITDHQKKVLEAVNLNLVEDVFGRDRFHELPKVKRSLLVDNLPHNSGNSKVKLQAIGGGMYLKIADWNGNNPQDTVLLKALTIINKAFSPSSPQ